jgi:glycosyltransferase involved in cell wall biosynthesis
VELVTSRFRHGRAPAADGYVRREDFYRLGVGSPALKAAQHPLDMMRVSARLRRAGDGFTHFQWLPLPQIDRHLVRRFPGPRVLTAHDLLPRGAGERRRRAAARLFEAMDAVVVHSEFGKARLTEMGLSPERVHVIPHGAFEHLARLPAGAAIDPEMDPEAGDLEGRPVALFFGLVRPYKGVDVLIEAFASAPPDAVLLVVGRALMPLEPLRRRARELGLGDRVRFVPRYVSDEQLASYFRRADIVVLPYREIEQSGVLFTALAFGSPIVASAVGGFVEVGERHAALRLVPPSDVGALGTALHELLVDESARARLSRAARDAAAGPYSWDRAAELTERLYRSLGGGT